jgi:GNAT superfamily N-acetyltransferase
MVARDANASEIEPLAKIWFDGWQDAHARVLPVELARLRTLESFQGRLAAALSRVRVVGPADAPSGFCMTKDAQLHQLYVAAHARGSGVAKALMADAEARLAACTQCVVDGEKSSRTVLGACRACESDSIVQMNDVEMLDVQSSKTSPDRSLERRSGKPS